MTATTPRRPPGGDTTPPDRAGAQPEHPNAAFAASARGIVLPLVVILLVVLAGLAIVASPAVTAWDLGVIRGIEGFGASSRIHTARLLSLAEGLPVAIIIVDSEDRIREFLPQLDGLVTDGLVMIDPVEVIRYVR